jgi:acetoin utilization deacetylase AcuC-like enzyme
MISHEKHTIFIPIIAIIIIMLKSRPFVTSFHFLSQRNIWISGRTCSTSSCQLWNPKYNNFKFTFSSRFTRQYIRLYSSKTLADLNMDPFVDLSLTSTNDDHMVQDSTNHPSLPSFPIYYNDVYEVPLPPNHRFPMTKYRKVRERIQSKLSSINNTQNKVHNVSFRISPLVSLQDLALTHCEDYIARYLQGQQTLDEIRNVGFPWSTAGVARSLSSTGGTVAAATAVCQAKRLASSHPNESKQGPFWSAHVAGGTHHAFHDRGEGFCVFSDIAVAANVILRDYSDVVKRILIVDLDVHQGNGNAVLFQGRHDVITFSMHCSSNYFSKKEESDLDIELPSGCDDETYLSTLHYWLNRIYKESNGSSSSSNSSTSSSKFDFIFYQAGVDILQSDRLGRMNISPEGVSRRNKMVYEWVTKKMNVPLVITMGGGYPKDDNWKPILEAHAGVYLEAMEYLCQL